MKARIALVGIAAAAAATAALALPAAANAVGGRISYWDSSGYNAVHEPAGGVCYDLTDSTIHVENNTWHLVGVFYGYGCDGNPIVLSHREYTDTYYGGTSVMVLDMS